VIVPHKESMAHARTKGLVADMIANGPGYLLISHAVDERWRTYRLDVGGLDVVIECAYPDATPCPDSDAYYAEHGHYPRMIFDVGLVWHGHVIAALEVMKSHWIDEVKRQKILASPVIVAGVTARPSDWLMDNARVESPDLIIPKKAAKIIHRIEIGAVA